MFGIFTGVIINAGLVICGTAVGLAFRKASFLEQIGERIFQAFALFVLVMGIKGAGDLSNTYMILGSIIVGTAFGELIDLDRRFTQFGDFMQSKFSSEKDSTFSKGFIQASLLYCVGSMSVVGSLQSGLDNNHTMLITKGILDAITAVTMSMGMGIGVGFSCLVIIGYQGLLTLCAGVLSPVLTAETIGYVSSVGNLFLIGMAGNMLKVTNLKLANFLPAMFVPMVWQVLMMALGRA